MTDEKGRSIQLLKALSEVDNSLARIRAERKKFEGELQELSKGVSTLETEVKNKQRESSELKRKYEREEKFLQAEREKLIGRRKSVGSLGDYKVQQAASREIESVSKQLDLQEDTLLKQMEDLDKRLAELKVKEETLAKNQEEVNARKESSTEFLTNIKQREDEKKQERDKISSEVDADFLRRYAIIVEKFPMDPVAAVINKQCNKCRMNIPPQILVKVSRGQTIEQCPGCHRIVYIEAVAEKTP